MGSAMALVVEHASPRRQGFFSSFASAGTQAGTVLASGAFALVALLPDEQFLNWGWRMPFLLSALIVAVAIFVRSSLPETLEDSSKSDVGYRMPLVEMLRRQWRQLIGAILVYCTIQVGWYLLTVFGITFAVDSGIDRSVMLWMVAGAALIAMCMNPFWGALSDRFGRRPIIIFGIIAYGVSTWLYFAAVGTANTWLVLVAMTAATGFGHAALNGVTPSFFMEAMNVSTRATTAGMAIQISGVIGGLAPLAATALVHSPAGIVAVGIVATSVFVVSIIGTFVLGRLPAEQRERDQVR